MHGHIRLQSPGQSYAVKYQLHEPRQIGRIAIGADFAALLAQAEHFGEQPLALLQALIELDANRRAGCMRRVDGAKQGGAFGSVSREIGGQIAQERHNRSAGLPSSMDVLLDGGEAFTAKSGEHVFLGGEIIKEGALADVGGFCDVLDGSFQEAALGKKLQGGAKQAIANFFAVALAAARARSSFSTEIGGTQ